MDNKTKYIDHTLLKAGAKKKDIDKLIDEAKEFQFKTICINSTWVKYASTQLKNSEVGITTVVGFPLGANITQIKVHEAKLAIEHGADEIDMVINIGKFKEREYTYVLNEINKIKETIGNHVLKVIVETALLTNQEIEEVSKLVLKSNADFIKTSTGFSFRGASEEDIKIMKKIVGNKKGIKAAGGVRSLEDLNKMITLGATRIGTSSGVAIFKNEKVDLNSKY